MVVDDEQFILDDYYIFTKGEIFIAAQVSGNSQIGNLYNYESGVYYSSVFNINGKVCIVTGAGRGIGKEIAQLFAAEGATVVVNEKTVGAADQWVAESLYNGQFDIRYFDIADEVTAKSAILDVKKKYGHIDVLVNNAGVEFNELIGMISRENMEKMFNVNV